MTRPGGDDNFIISAFSNNYVSQNKTTKNDTNNNTNYTNNTIKNATNNKPINKNMSN